jgi:hypothetical protein
MVHIDDPRGRWSVSASEVLRIIPAVEWTTGPSVDVLAALGALPPGRNRRVLIMRGVHNRQIALIAAGALAVAEVATDDVLPLPSVLAAAAPQVSAVIIASDASLSLLIEPSAVTPSGDTVVGEELCPSHS